MEIKKNVSSLSVVVDGEADRVQTGQTEDSLPPCLFLEGDADHNSPRQLIHELERTLAIL